jgi:O-antigen/teichoic acid export membrane protein
VAEAGATAALTPLASARHVGRRFVSDLAYFSVANVLYLLLTGITTFLIPRVLSVEAFGGYRLFLLYAGYAGVLHFGYLDGALISWSNEDRNGVARQLPTALVIVSVALLTFVAAATAIWFFAPGERGRWLVPPLTVFAIIANLLTISQYALQAQKRFRLLSALTLLMPLLLLVGVGALAATHSSSVRALLTVYLLADAVVLCAAWTALSPLIHWYWPALREVQVAVSRFFRAGFAILLVNLSANLIISADRLVISSHFPMRQFAVYSFAATFFYSGFLVILSATKVAFPYLSTEIPREHWVHAYGTCERVVLVLWTLGLLAYFPIAWLTVALLPDYMESLQLIRILLLSSGAAAMTQVLHFNFFRLLSRTGTMLLVASITLAGGFTALLLALPSNSLSRMAWTTAAIVIFWWIAGEVVLTTFLRRSLGEILNASLWMCITMMAFLFCTASVSGINWLVYIVFALVVSALILRKDYRTLRMLRNPHLRFKASEQAS